MDEDDRYDLNRVVIEGEYFRQTANVAFGRALVSNETMKYESVYSTKIF